MTALDLTFPRTARFGQRRVVTMWRDGITAGDGGAQGVPVATQEAFDECEPWVDWCFGMAAEGKEET